MKVKIELNEEEMERREMLLAAIAAELPPIIFRNWPRWRDVLWMAPRSVANDSSRGEGPTEKVYAGRVCGYPKQAFLEYLRKRIRFTEKPGGLK